MSWELVSSLVVGAALVLGFAWYERSRPPARVLALVAALAALAIVGRLAFAPFPNVKPTTDIVLFAGYALGGAPGFAVGSVTALVSNVFLTHGPWTPWQMAAWGGVGLAGGALGALVRSRSRRTTEGAEPRELGRWTLALACGVAGLGYGLVMDLYLWTLAGERTLASYAVISARSLPFNVAHVVGNVVLCLLIGPPLVLALRRYRRRFEVRWAAPRAAASASAALAAAFGFALLDAPPARADGLSERVVRYLIASQNADGSFSGERGGVSEPSPVRWGSARRTTRST
jgi:energy-coupling factor transport system substrate-specific component